MTAFTHRGFSPHQFTPMSGAHKSVETNRRPASPFNAGRQFGSASCAPLFLSAAVAHLWRCPMNTPLRSIVCVSFLLIGPAELEMVHADDCSVRVAWIGTDDVLLELDHAPTNFVLQVSQDLWSWQDQLDVCTRSNRVQVFDRDASPASESSRFYLLRVPGVSVEAARSTWQAQAVQNYAYHFQRTCFCLPEIIREADVVVRDGQVVGATNVEYGWSPDPSSSPESPTRRCRYPGTGARCPTGPRCRELLAERLTIPRGPALPAERDLGSTRPLR